MKLKDLNILAVGDTIQLAGAIYADGDQVFLVPLPDALTDAQHHNMTVTVLNTMSRLLVLDMDLADWQTFIRQTDLMETEIFNALSDNKKIGKAIVRKSNRQISQGVSWAVYKRDGYCCRYCAAEGVPMTVDHLVLWEHGGPSIEGNLVTACRKCNKIRGNTEYADWLKHPFYKKVSRNLAPETRGANEAILGTLAAIPRLVHKPKKR